MTPFLIAFFIALGAGAWIFTKLQQKTGYGNGRTTWTGTIISVLVIFFVVYISLRLFQ
jgi:hypothetical protein